jgi:hypothetical protein
MDVGGHQLRERAHPGAVARGGRQQRPLGPAFIQVFQDRQRLAHHPRAVHQGGHHVLRIEPGVLGLMLLAALAQQVHRVQLMAQPLQVEADPDPVGGAGAPIGIQPQELGHARKTSIQWAAS